jgi:hypothetical protein
MASQPRSSFCWICNQEVALENCKTDERGWTVHEDCYVARMKFEKESARSNQPRGYSSET